jgi:hypothetical protein
MCTVDYGACRVHSNCAMHGSAFRCGTVHSMSHCLRLPVNVLESLGAESLR